MIDLSVCPAALVAACLPLGDKRVSREEKRAAILAVVNEGVSYWRAGRPTGTEWRTVRKWVDEFVTRLRLAESAAHESQHTA